MDAQTVNDNFIIRVYPSLTGLGNNSILSYNTLVDLIGEDLADKNIRKAWDSGLDKFTFKLRRGVKIELVAK
jgi:hypothetical protein